MREKLDLADREIKIDPIKEFHWTKKNLLSLEELSKEEILHVLKTAASFKEVSSGSVKKVPALRGKTIANLFFESSTRTRASFELAAKRLSADIVNFSVLGSSTDKGETLKDTARNIEAMNIDLIVMRHASSGSAEYLARSVNAGVINAGPLQAVCFEHKVVGRFRFDFQIIAAKAITDLSKLFRRP